MKILNCMVLAALIFAAGARAQSNPVGFNTVTCLKNSDTLCSVPFCQSIDVQDRVSGLPTFPATGFATFSPQNLVAWTAGQFVTGHYFVRMLSGPKAGMYYLVAANTSNSLTIDLAGDNFTGVGNNDGFMVCKFWTLATLFPPATQTTIVASLNLLGPGRRTELLLPDTIGNGINLAPTKKYFIHAGAWKEANTGFPLAGNTILLPDSYFIVRHNSAAITNSTTFTSAGHVELNAVSMPLATLPSGKQDNPVSTGRPIPVKLADMDLISSGAFVASDGPGGPRRKDELIVFDNNIASVNRSAAATYFYNSETAKWHQSTTNFPVADNVEIAPGTGFLIRKYISTGITSIWTHAY